MAGGQLGERIEVARGRYYTVEEVCAIYRVSRRTVYRWKKAGKLHPVRAGRRLMFERGEVDSLASSDGEL